MKPAYNRHGVRVFHGDSLDVLAQLDDASVDSVVTDPPYGLGFMGKPWDQPGEFGSTRRGRHGTPPPPGVGDHRKTTTRSASMHAGEYDMSAAGMHNFQRWCEAWAAECWRVLKPGGHLVAFGGTRTFHRLTCGIEDAGFEIRDGLSWLYGSGFPKSRDVGKAIDEVAPRAGMFAAFAAHFWERWQVSGLRRIDFVPHFPHYKNADSVMAQLSNWKLAKNVPSVHDFAILRDLLHLDGDWSTLIDRVEAERAVTGSREGTVLAVAPDQGVNRPAVDLAITAPATDAARQWHGWGTALKPAWEPIILARKPLSGTVAGNVVAHGTGALNIDGCRVAGDGSHKRPVTTKQTTVSGDTRTGAALGMYSAGSSFTPTNHDGGRWPSNVVLLHAITCTVDPVWCDPSCPVAELDKQSGVTTSGSRKPGEYGLMGYMGADVAHMPAVDGDSGGASRFFPIFRWEAKAPTSERPMVNGRAHPTVKPIALMRWLVRLITPPGGLVLDPFAGTGTTGQAARAEGMRALLIDADPEAIGWIKARLDARARQTETTTTAGPQMETLDLLDLLDGEAS